MPGPAVNVVTMISSKRQPEREDRTGDEGRAQHREGDAAEGAPVRVAPRSIEASSTLPRIRRRRATALL